MHVHVHVKDDDPQLMKRKLLLHAAAAIVVPCDVHVLVHNAHDTNGASFVSDDNCDGCDNDDANMLQLVVGLNVNLSLLLLLLLIEEEHGDEYFFLFCMKCSRGLIGIALATVCGAKDSHLDVSEEHNQEVGHRIDHEERDGVRVDDKANSIHHGVVMAAISWDYSHDFDCDKLAYGLLKEES